MQEFIEKIVSNLVISAFVPSLCFVTMVGIAFDPILPPTIKSRLDNFLSPAGLLLVIFTVILGFTMLNMNNIIQRLYRGIFLSDLFGFSSFFEERRSRKLCEKIAKIEQEIRDRELQGEVSDSLQKLKNNHYALLTYKLDTFPMPDRGLLPTRFGNILRAAEVYPADRYGIDAVLIWPRMMQVIPEAHYSRIEQTNNQLSFVVNFSFLSIVFSALCLLAALYQFILHEFSLSGQVSPIYFVPIDSPSEVYFQRSLFYITVFVLCVLISILFYRASLPIAHQYGDMFRTTFDLFRFNLLEQLKLDLPQDSRYESDTWAKISEFMLYGCEFGPLLFEYKVHPEVHKKDDFYVDSWLFRLLGLTRRHRE